jgi:hypothetical protein
MITCRKYRPHRHQPKEPWPVETSCTAGQDFYPLMSDHEQIMHFADDLDKLVERYRLEYDVAYGSIIGTLHMKAHLLCQEAAERDEEV